MPITFLAAFASVVGLSEAIRHTQSKSRRQEHRSRKNNLTVHCIKSTRWSPLLESKRIVLSGDKLYVDTGEDWDEPFGYPFAGYFLPYPDTKFSGLVSQIMDEPPMMNWIYVDKDTYEVKFGSRAWAEAHLTGPFDCTRQERRLTFGGWEGFCLVQEGCFWSLYFDLEDDMLRSKVPRGTPVLEIELTRKEMRVRRPRREWEDQPKQGDEDFKPKAPTQTPGYTPSAEEAEEQKRLEQERQREKNARKEAAGGDGGGKEKSQFEPEETEKQHQQKDPSEIPLPPSPILSSSSSSSSSSAAAAAAAAAQATEDKDREDKPDDPSYPSPTSETSTLIGSGGSAGSQQGSSARSSSCSSTRELDSSSSSPAPSSPQIPLSEAASAPRQGQRQEEQEDGQEPGGAAENTSLASSKSSQKADDEASPSSSSSSSSPWPSSWPSRPSQEQSQRQALEPESTAPPSAASQANANTPAPSSETSPTPPTHARPSSPSLPSSSPSFSPSQPSEPPRTSQPRRSTNYRAPTVEDVQDEGEPVPASQFLARALAHRRREHSTSILEYIGGDEAV